ncbi:ABC transporter permease [Mameliella alba]|uniref:Binding-protein-dependent transport systems inner membrane component n=1 Tax=Mameliella alba TaxID=561184 RepID=A0A0B3S0B2_9RHOB|nr:ABC transporter permease [Mameliella alba]KHQ52393.1 Binding-protein-dependent transport systems inner membrane component [Mameliella alba]MBY6120539.1 ABC transporter permease [Mameliella alba]OWV42859.1 ABC transporter permease [Mameliella alba]OWV46900.1 ABC transporter permease [Mameliella alba]OWV63529.1 ABC transporter permease [Mameliella alba]
MSTVLWSLGAIVVLLAGGWVMRLAGQSLTGNKPFFRDMPLAVAFGYVLGAALLLFGIWYYFQPAVTADGVPVASVQFFRWAVQGVLIGAAAAFVFRLIGRTLGTAGSRKMFRQMPLTAAFGVLVILIYALLAIFAPALAPHGQEEVFGQANIVPGGNPALGGNPDFPLGTDQIGRDILSRLIYGAQNTVGIAFATTLLAFVLGGTFGFLAATLRGWMDQVLSRMVDVLMAIPSLIFSLLLITVASAWVSGFGLTVAMVVIIAVIDSTRVFRLARAVGMNIVVMDYIEAAKLRGEGLPYLIFREILPNATAPLLAEFGLRFCFVFLTISALSFLGLGIQPPLADWGTMVKDLSAFINYASFAPLAASVPLLAAGAIALLTVAVNFVVDWMLNRSSGLKD